jgi:hypothetical protein
VKAPSRISTSVGDRADGADQVAGGEDRRQFEAADDVAEQQDAGEQREAAAAGDRQRHARALARLGRCCQ